MPDSTVTVSGINVPALPDNNIWFANAAAWTNYWSQGEFTFSFSIPAATTTNAGLVKEANTNAYVPGTTPIASQYSFQNGIDDNENPVIATVPTMDYINAMNAQLQALITNFTQLKTAMVAAGQANNV